MGKVSFTKRTTAVLLFAVLLLCLLPMAAFADIPNSGAQGFSVAQPTGPVSTHASSKSTTKKKAKTKYVWVVTRATQMREEMFSDWKFSYNKKGLVTKASMNSFGYGHDITYKYDAKNRIKKMSHKEGGDGIFTTSTYTFKKDKKGRVKAALLNGKSVARKYRYNSKGLLTEVRYGDGYKTTYKYDKKKHVVKIISSSNTVTFRYDKKGYIKKMAYKEYKDRSRTFKNYYKGSRLVKQVTNNSYDEPIVYKYKKIKVPASQVKRIKAQQRMIMLGEAEDTLPQFLEAVYA